MPLVAHVGHWSVWLLYALPVVIVVVVLVTSAIRQRGTDVPTESRFPGKQR